MKDMRWQNRYKCVYDIVNELVYHSNWSIEDAVEFINSIEDATVVPDIYVGNKWISVKDRLPDKNGEYLTCRCGDLMDVLRYSAVHKLFNAYDNLSEDYNKKFAVAVDYWMPLPEAPKEE